MTRQPTTSVSPVYTQTHDAAGRQTEDGRDYTYRFDGFVRLKEVRNRSNSALVAEYTYNGLNFRTGWHYDVTRSGGGAPDGTVDSNDPWYWFIYNERWQTVGTFRGSDANPKERFIYHGAGLGGRGGSSYIDSVVCLDRDLTNGWAGAADGTLEARFYINQNWRGECASCVYPRLSESDGCAECGFVYLGIPVQYDYLGVGQTVRTVLQEPDSTTALTNNPTWTTAPGYTNMDLFNRTTRSHWTNTSAVDYSNLSVNRANV